MIESSLLKISATFVPQITILSSSCKSSAIFVESAPQMTHQVTPNLFVLNLCFPLSQFLALRALYCGNVNSFAISLLLLPFLLAPFPAFFLTTLKIYEFNLWRFKIGVKETNIVLFFHITCLFYQLCLTLPPHRIRPREYLIPTELPLGSR